MAKRFACSGFTLVEMLVAMTLMAILLMLAAPSFTDLVNSVRRSFAINAFYSSLMFARNEAIKRNARVVLCKSVNGAACTNSGGWEQGWIVFQDSNNNAELSAGEPVLSRAHALPGRLRLTGNLPLSNYVSYTRLGTTSYISGAFQAGRLVACVQSSTPVESSQIVISSSGRPRTIKMQVERCPA